MSTAIAATGLDAASSVSSRVVHFWIAALFSLPFLVPYHWLPNTAFYSHWAALAIGSCAIVPIALRWFRERGATLSVPLIAWVAIGLIAILLLQHFLGLILYVQWLLVPAATLLVAAVVCSSGWRDVRTDPVAIADVIAWTLLVGGLAQCAWAVVQIAGYELIRFEMVARPADAPPLRVGGVLMQANQFVLYLVWSLAGLLHLVFRGRLPRMLGAIAAVGFMVFLAFAGSRSTFVYLFVLGPALSVALYRLGRPAGWWAPCAAPIAYVAIDQLVRWFVGAFVSDGLRLVLRPIELETAGIRLALLRDAFSMFQDAPLLGKGWGAFAGERFAMDSPALLELNNDHAHNIVAHLLAETGIVGTAVVVGGLLLWAWRALATPLSFERMFFLGLVAAIALYSLLEFPLWTAFFLLPTALLMGALETRATRVSVTRGFSRAIGGLSLLLVAAIWLAPLDYIRIERQYLRFFGFSEESVAKPSAILDMSGLSLFRLEGEQLYLRAAPLDSLYLLIDAPVSARVLRATPAPEFAARHANHLIMLGRPAEAAQLLARTCSWSPQSCDWMRSDLVRLSTEAGGPFTSFAESHLDAAFPRR